MTLWNGPPLPSGESYPMTAALVRADPTAPGHPNLTHRATKVPLTWEGHDRDSGDEDDSASAIRKVWREAMGFDAPGQIEDHRETARESALR